MSDRYAVEASLVRSSLPAGRRLIVVGGTSFWGTDSGRLCERVATRFAAIPDAVLVTGGMSGVGATFARAFADEPARLRLPLNVAHLLPRGFGDCDTGVTLFAGEGYTERREVLGRLGAVYLVIEGGPGTEHEVEVARQNGATVIAVGRSGGCAGNVYPTTSAFDMAEPADWRLLGDAAAPLERVAEAVGRLIDEAFRRTDTTPG